MPKKKPKGPGLVTWPVLSKTNMALEPQQKKARLEGSFVLESGNRRDIATPRALLADEYTRQFETVEVFAAEVKDRTKTSELIRNLNDKFPVRELGHLKRVRCVKSEKDSVIQIILCYKEERNVDLQLVGSLEEFLQQNGIDSACLGKPFVVNVAKHPPLTREQFNQASVCWPVNFHEDKYISRALRGELFNDEEVQLITKFMEMAITEAKKRNSQKFPIGAMIVDPQSNHPIAMCHDLRCTGHPLQHAVMVCIDLVAHSQSSGAWHLDCKDMNGTWTLKENESLQQNVNSADCDIQFTDINSSEAKMLLDAKSSVHNEPCNVVNNTDDGCKSGPYLCTGYDLYVTREPCVMCAMALVHSRIRRVFYGCRDSVMGALGSRYKIHTQAGLNHHFEVFCGVLEEKCSSVFERMPP